MPKYVFAALLKLYIEKRESYFWTFLYYCISGDRVIFPTHILAMSLALFQSGILPIYPVHSVNCQTLGERA